MTDDRELSLILDRWLADGPVEMPDRVIDAVATGISRQRQRPTWRLDRMRIHVNAYKPAAAIAAVTIVVAIIGISLNGGPPFTAASASPSDRGSPSPTAPPSPTPSTTATPTAGPSRAALVLNDKGMVVIEHFTARVGTRIEYLLPDGRSQELLPDVPGDQFSPAWRPDGLSLAFVAAQSGDDDRLGIWTTDASGTTPTKITTDCTPPDCFEESDPSYSPDGTRMVFMRSTGTIATGPTSTIIAVRDLTTGVVSVLERTRTAIADGEVHHPRLSPDGKTVLYHVLQRRSNGDAVESAIFTAAVDGTGKPVRLGPADLHPTDGEWSRDGSTIAFTSTGVHDWNCCNWARLHMYVMAADGTGVTQLDTGGWSGAASWSPDGTQILYTHGSDKAGIGIQSINVMGRDGSGDRTIARFGDCCRWYPVQRPTP